MSPGLRVPHPEQRIPRALRAQVEGQCQEQGAAPQDPNAGQVGQVSVHAGVAPEVRVRVRVQGRTQAQG